MNRDDERNGTSVITDGDTLGECLIMPQEVKSLEIPHELLRTTIDDRCRCEHDRGLPVKEAGRMVSAGKKTSPHCSSTERTARAPEVIFVAECCASRIQD